MTCSEVLRAEGKAYPRTCAEHGLGPCPPTGREPALVDRPETGHRILDDDTNVLRVSADSLTVRDYSADWRFVERAQPVERMRRVVLTDHLGNEWCIEPLLTGGGIRITGHAADIGQHLVVQPECSNVVRVRQAEVPW